MKGRADGVGSHKDRWTRWITEVSIHDQRAGLNPEVFVEGSRKGVEPLKATLVPRATKTSNLSPKLLGVIHKKAQPKGGVGDRGGGGGGVPRATSCPKRSKAHRPSLGESTLEPTLPGPFAKTIRKIRVEKNPLTQGKYALGWAMKTI